MSVTKKTYILGKHNQLIDLNGDTVNFDITFVVTSENKETFEMAIVDQKTLDNSPDIPFRKALQGSLSGNIIQDSNEYQNYFLALKSGNSCKVNVEITKQEIPVKESPVLAPTPIPMQKRSIQQPVSPMKLPTPIPKKSFFTMKYVVIGLIIIGGGFLLYHLYMRKEVKSVKEIKVKSYEPFPYDKNPIKIHSKINLSPIRNISPSQRSVASSSHGSIASSIHASDSDRSVASSKKRSVASSNKYSGSDHGIAYKPTSSTKYRGDVGKSSLFSRIQNIPM